MSNGLKFWRIERRISQVELATATGIPRYRIQLIEQGVAPLTPEEAIKISKTLGCLLTDLLADWPEATPESES